MSEREMTSWRDLAATSHYQTAVAVKDSLHEGDVAQATLGIQELIDALSRSDKRAVRSQLARLMAHIIKWQTQPERRSTSWRRTIRHARSEIAAIRDETPSISQEYLESIWQECFLDTRADAEDEMKQECLKGTLSWEEVFEAKYELDDER